MSWQNIIKYGPTGSELNKINDKIKEVFKTSNLKPGNNIGDSYVEINLHSTALDNDNFKIIISQFDDADKKIQERLSGKRYTSYFKSIKGNIEGGKTISSKIKVTSEEIMQWIQLLHDEYFSPASFVGSFE